MTALSQCDNQFGSFERTGRLTVALAGGGWRVAKTVEASRYLSDSPRTYSMSSA